MILMDIDLGDGIDGTQAAVEIQNIVDIPIVFLSSHTDPEMVKKTEGITSYGYIVKDSGPTVLISSIKMAFRLFSAKIAMEKTLAAKNSSFNMLKLIIENTPAAVAVFDRDMRYLFVSHQYYTDYGIKQPCIIGESHYAIFPELTPEHRAAHQRCLDGEHFKSRVGSFVRSDGKLEWGRWELHPWHDETGQIGGVVHFSVVITEHVNKVAELEETIERLRSAIGVNVIT